MIIRAENKRSGNVRYWPKRTARGINSCGSACHSASVAASARYKRAAITGPKSSRTRAAELLVSITLRSRFSLASNAIASVRQFDGSAISSAIPNVPLVPKQKQQNDNWYWNADKPKQYTSTHDRLYLLFVE